MSMTMWEFQVFEALSFAFCNQQISRHTKKSVTLNKGHAQTADKVKVSGQIFCKKPFQITRNMV